MQASVPYSDLVELAAAYNTTPTAAARRAGYSTPGAWAHHGWLPLGSYERIVAALTRGLGDPRDDVATKAVRCALVAAQALQHARTLIEQLAGTGPAAEKLLADFDARVENATRHLDGIHDLARKAGAL